MRSAKSIGLLAVAMVMALASGFAGYMYLNQREQALVEEMNAKANYVEVLVPMQNLMVGDIVSADTVSVRPVPSDFVPDTAIYPTEFEAVAGMTVSEPITAGKPLQRHHLEGVDSVEKFSQLLKPGQRAITLEIDNVESNENMLDVGDYIDVAVLLEIEEEGDDSGEDDNKIYSVLPILEKVLVLATGNRTIADPPVYYEDQAYDEGYGSITLGIDAKKITTILAAKEQGDLVFLLRNPEDKNKLKLGQGDAGSLASTSRVRVFTGNNASNGLLTESYKSFIPATHQKRLELANLTDKEYRKYVPSDLVAGTNKTNQKLQVNSGSNVETKNDVTRVSN